jgi:hypothetical protein
MSDGAFMARSVKGDAPAQRSQAPSRTLIERWRERGVSRAAIHAALCREHGYTGRYSAITR